MTFARIFTITLLAALPLSAAIRERATATLPSVKISGIIRDAALVLAVALNFLFDLAWVKYPREKRVATPPASPES